jgi:hypothetical protein
VLEIDKAGGEGGIRTLGTGVSPYNGLAKGSFLAALTRFQELTSDSGPPSRAQGLSFGSYCAPLCAPFFAPLVTVERAIPHMPLAAGNCILPVFFTQDVRAGRWSRYLVTMGA